MFYVGLLFCCCQFFYVVPIARARVCVCVCGRFGYGCEIKLCMSILDLSIISLRKRELVI